tara:strand:- start:522 stop:725 length:204 start_codon:yes stop_codon:yes gene_type:complete
MLTKYYVSAGADNWSPTKARTLPGAMRAATARYEVSYGGRIEVAELIEYQYCPVAVKKGLNAWDYAR